MRLKGNIPSLPNLAIDDPSLSFNQIDHSCMHIILTERVFVTLALLGFRTKRWTNTTRS